MAISQVLLSVRCKDNYGNHTRETLCRAKFKFLCAPFTAVVAFRAAGKEEIRDSIDKVIQWLNSNQLAEADDLRMRFLCLDLEDKVKVKGGDLIQS